MGAAAIAVFPEPQRPTATVAFGNLLDLARLRRGTAEGEVEVCEACQTINAPHAYFCKGCDGKLPAYFAALDAGTLVVPPAQAAEDPEERRSRFAVFALVALWGTVTVVALLQAHGPRADPPTSTVQAVVQAPVERVAARVEPPAIDRRDRADVAHPPAPPAEEARREARSLAAAAGPRTEAADSRPLRRPSPAPAVRVARSGGKAGNPVARCEGLNFFARAVCMNNQCARPEARRSPQCAETVRQARLGEARRNPKLAG